MFLVLLDNNLADMLVLPVFRKTNYSVIFSRILLKYTFEFILLITDKSQVSLYGQMQKTVLVRLEFYQFSVEPFKCIF